ncbi:MAG: hypothetical protein OEX12_13950 [Gammaproteobacteria bacterium]|nr:hypothetical protein [Gammaproteobacteria bacterium]
MSQVGTNMLAAILQSQSVSDFVDLGLAESFFTDAEVEGFKFIKGFLKQHGAIPSLDTFLTDAGVYQSLPVTVEPITYYAEELRKRHIHRKMTGALLEAKAHLVENKNPEEALNSMLTACSKLVMQKQGNSIVDFRFSEDAIIQTYKNVQLNEGSIGIPFGWSTLDTMSGGAMPGDLISYVGRPATGKTFKLLYSALNAWKHHNKRVLFLSMEMLPIVLQHRLIAMETHVSLTHLNKATLGSPTFKKLKQGLVEIKGAESPFWIIDGNLTANVEDLWTYARMLKPDMIVIDGAYLLGHHNPRLNRFERVADNTRLMKTALATDMKVPVSASWQFNRTAAAKAKKKGDDSGDLEDIGFSDEIGQLSSLVLGLFQGESIETMHHRTVKVLKGRSGETGQFNIHWDFYGMDFSEYIEPSHGQLQFV